MRRLRCEPVADKRAIAAVAGDSVEAHKHGCGICRKLTDVETVTSDIVITSNGGYPLDQTIYQSAKGITAAEACVWQGVIIIMSADLGDGHGGDA